jgi:hypothetical protein
MKRKALLIMRAKLEVQVRRYLTTMSSLAIMVKAPNALTQTFLAQQGRSKLLIYEKYSP